jgi:hypothetical protein
MSSGVRAEEEVMGGDGDGDGDGSEKTSVSGESDDHGEFESDSGILIT